MTKEAFELTGRVEAVLAAMTPGSIVSMNMKKIGLVRGHGVKGDSHAGVRLADVRERPLLSFGLPKGIEIANHREFSAVSLEELAEIGALMGLPSPVPHGCLGENLVLSGIPRLTELPSGTLLFFRKNEAQIRTAVLAVWGENTPCQLPGEAIQERFPGIPGLAALFPKSAIGKRGVVGSVYCSGTVHVGDEVVVKVPRQRLYGA
jgi:MOSC domain-containing protein